MSVENRRFRSNLEAAFLTHPFQERLKVLVLSSPSALGTVFVGPFIQQSVFGGLGVRFRAGLGVRTNARPPVPPQTFASDMLAPTLRLRDRQFWKG
jgi:hypothetical protein